MTADVDHAFPPYVELGPEQLFRVESVSEDDHTSRASMATGSWVTAFDGSPSAGSLGTLVDNGWGYSVAHRTPIGMATVTSHIHLDLVSPPPSDGMALSTDAESVAFDSAGGVVTGRVLSADGRIVAVGSLRGRFIDGSATDNTWFALDAADEAVTRSPNRSASALDAINAELVRGVAGIELAMTVDRTVVNVRANLHGGVTFCAVEAAGYAAATALGDAADNMRTTSVDVLYLRPAPLGARLTFRATVVHSGRSFRVVEVVGFVDRAKPIATATVVCMAAAPM